METLFTILCKSASITILFYSFYRLFLQKETYFNSIRYFLLIGIISAVIIPFIIIPVYVDVTNIASQQFNFSTIGDNTFTSQTALLTWPFAIKLVYFIVTSALLLRFIIQLTSIVQLIRKSETVKKEGYFLVKTSMETSPFSFFNYIVYNPSQFNKHEFTHILTHEKVHAIQKHSIDTLLANVLAIIQWFNPIAWMYKRDIEQNLEFIADEYTQKVSKSNRLYQQLLLKTTIPNYQMALANNFYNSLLKKRIIMLHKQRSNSTTQWKMAFIAPLLIAFIFTFNTETIAQQKQETKKIVTETIEVYAMGFTKTATKEELDNMTASFKKKGLDLAFKGIKRNNANEIIAIKIDAKSKNGKAAASYAADVEEGINPIQISFDNDNNNLSIGSSKNGQHAYSFHTDKKNKEMHIKGEGKRSNKFVFLTDDDDDENVWITKKGNKKVIIEIDTDNHSDEDVHEIIIDEDNDGKKVKKEVIKIRKKKGKGEEKMIFISSSDGGQPLYLVDGKEITQEEMDKIDSDTIEKIEVLKGDKAIEKHGKKAENGVVIITTKKKK
tara:strand:- start:132095 stop:133753 length:1659 start_codon:yes stop_codon:yes gene_type:complete